MMYYRAVLFDLDGTLLDTLRDLAEAMNAALAERGFPPHPAGSYKKFVGEGVESLARKALPADTRDDALVRELAEKMKTEYSMRWDKNTGLYAGISLMLDGLTARGIRLAVLSNKPHEITKTMCAHYLGRWNFECALGARAGVPRKPDPAAALLIAREMRLAPADFLYLGDSGTDMQTARAAGMFPVGALWGFRDAEELAGSGAERLISRPEDLLVFF